jgi:HEAT repeat protein
LAILARDPSPERAVAKAHVAVLRARLGSPSALGGLLASLDPAEVRAAVEEAGASKLLGAAPETVIAGLKGHADATVREALAAALGLQAGPTARRALVDLLVDSDREVRAAAAAALVPHDPDDMKDYDPDGKPDSWRKVQERLRR